MLPKKVWILVVLMFASMCLGAAKDDPMVRFSALLDAIEQVESKHNPNPPGSNDNGLAIGSFQIHYDYWLDSGVPGKYEDCRDPIYARRVVVGYWRRYAAKNMSADNWKALARVHNGGPAGASHKATLGYWKLVQDALASPTKK